MTPRSQLTVSVAAVVVAAVSLTTWAHEEAASQALVPPSVPSSASTASGNPTTPPSPTGTATATQRPSVTATHPSTKTSGTTKATKAATATKTATSSALRTLGTAPRPKAPTRLRIPSLGVDAPIDAVGVDAAGGMAIPFSATTVGWYRYNPAPGAPRGSAVLAGHVTLGRQRGALFSLARLEEGASIRVTDAAGARRTFRVTRVRQAPKANLALAGIFDREGKPRLIVMTCGGPYDAAAHAYRDNVIVEASPR